MLTNKMNLPQPFVDAAGERRKPIPNRYSVTTLLKGTCETILSRRHYDEIDEDVSDKVWAIFGSAVHKILEEGRETASQTKEGSIKVGIMGGRYTLSGIFDLYDASTGTVTDYKTAGTIKWQKREFDDYRMQTMIYCWMLRKTGFEASRGEIVMILRDWVKSKAKFDPEYPQTQVQRIEFEFTEDDFAKCEEFVNDKFAEFATAEALEDDELTPCSEEERWHRPDTWAVVKDGCKKAYRVLDCESDAVELAGIMSKDGRSYHVDFRPGEDAKCDGYCAVRQWCPMWSKGGE